MPSDRLKMRRRYATLGVIAAVGLAAGAVWLITRPSPSSRKLSELATPQRRGQRDSAAALERIVHACQERGQTEELMTAAREWIKLEPHHPRPWIWLIQTLKNEERRDAECLQAIRDALVQDLPDDVHLELQHRLVEQLIVCGDTKQARPALMHLIDAQGKTFRLQLCLVDLYRLEGQPGQALDALEQVFDQASDPALACLTRGIILLDLGRYAEAAGDLRRTVAAHPTNSTAHFKLSEAYRGSGRHELARKHREIADGLNAQRSEIARLQRQVRGEFADATISRQLAKLYRELGEAGSARLWEQRASQLASPAAESSGRVAPALDRKADQD